MTISVFVEPSAKGFRASTGSPLELTAEAKTADEAVAAVRKQFAARVKAGGELRRISLMDFDELVEGLDRLQKNPMFEEVEESIRKYRQKHYSKPSRK
jgi:hypothetical protein